MKIAILTLPLHTNYGGILQCYCVGMCEGYTMALSLQVITGLAADLSKGPLRTSNLNANVVNCLGA